jgi:amino acid adenylation domain-containing protein
MTQQAVSIQDLTPEQLAKLQERLRALRGQGPAQAGIPRRQGTGPVPLSFAQQRLWFVDRLQPGNAAYNMPAAVRLRGRLDTLVLARSLDEVVRRHETLRTTFPLVDGEPVQAVAPSGRCPLPLVDLAALPVEAREREALRLVRDESLRPFDLAGGPLLRGTLLRLADEEHLALFTMHHVISDAWSARVLIGELSALYGAFSRGAPSPLPELPVQYADYTLWQRERVSGTLLETQLAYWRRTLAGAPPVLEIPTDRPRGGRVGVAGASRAFHLPTPLARTLAELAQREGATLFMTVMAAWQLLLGRWAGQDDVVVGTPIANRTRVEVEGLIGFFANTLALRADLSGDPPFRELLGRVREATLGAHAHQDLPFERLVQELGVDRGAASSPVFQAMLVYGTEGGNRLRLGPVEVETLDADAAAAKYDLSLVLAEEDGGLRGMLTYRTDLFDAATVQRMLDHYAALLAEVAADASRPLADYALLGEGERRQVLEAWNATSAPIADPRPVHEVFAAHAARTPDAPAIVFGAKSISYGALEACANRLARHLRGVGVGPDARVGLCLERGPDAVAAVLGILKAGGAYVPLDPAHPPDRLRVLLADARPAAVVTDAARADRVAGFAGPVVRMDTDGDALARHDAAPLPPAAAPENVAYVLYTSGSTGTPRGVLVEHRNLLNYLAWFDRTVLGAEGFAIPLLSRLSFDAHVRALFSPLLRGEPVWVLPEETVSDPRALLEALAGHARPSFGGVPSLWAALVDGMEAGGPRPAGLRVITLGGEALPPELLARTRVLFPGVPVWNFYGPTETTVNATVARLDGARITIGSPIANLRAYVLDARLRPLPVGVPGELYAGGAGVARGYHGLPGRTAERFVPDPFTGEPGERMYRTGDRARWTAEGTLEYLGRTDDQVKVRGVRMEPGEVQALLERHPAVREAAVVARGDGGGDARLVAYVAGAGDVAGEGDAGLSPAALRAYLRERLPEYMVPGAFVVLDGLPRMPNGKLDRRALPAPDAAGEGGEAYVAPRTPVEQALAGVFAEVVRAERVGAADDFFALGGHSLLATRLVSRVREAFGIELPLRAVFEAPTVERLAEQVESLLRAGAGTQAPPIVPVPRDGALPLSFAQQRLWFIDQLEPGSATYNLPYAVRLRGAVDADALERSLTEVVRRHESLRTRFVSVDGQAAQVIDPPHPIRLTVVELADGAGLAEGTGDAREAALRTLVEEEALRPFDLAAGLPIRGTLVRLEEEDHALLLTLHHIASDGWSTTILVREIAELYGAFTEGRAPSLPPLPVQYADYAAWQRGWLRGEVLEAQLDYWRGRLAGAPPVLELPTDHPAPLAAGSAGARVSFRLSAETSEALRALGRGEGATTSMTMLAGWQALLARYARQSDISVGTPIAGRGRLETEGLIGFFVNTLVLRTDVAAARDFRGLVRQVREHTLGAYAHQDVPFERLVEELAPERRLGQSPLFQVMFDLVATEPGAGVAMLGAARVEPLEGTAAVAKTDLMLTVHDDGRGAFSGTLDYRTDRFEAATAARMLAHLAALLDAAAADPDAALATLPMLAEDERARVTHDFALGAPVPGPDRSIHAVFAARADAAPDAVALSWDGGQMTFAELDRASSRLAHHLVARGARAGDGIGLLVERGPRLIVGMVAALKAGGSYVPLDPAYPVERLAFMLDEADARVVLTENASREAADAVAGYSLFPIPYSLQFVDLDAEHTAIEAAPQTNPGIDLGPGALAHVIYTSGSTGKPKGVAIPHGAIVGLIREGEFADLGPGSAWLHLAPATFDATTLEVWPALLSGGRVVLYPNRPPDPAGLGESIRAHGVTHIWLTSGLFNLVVDEDIGALAGMRHVMTGGDVVSIPHARRALEAHPSLRLTNGYGPTENTVFTTCHDLSAADWTCASLPVGGPLAGTQAYVLDAVLNPSPIGVPGELYAGGEGLAWGYLRRPALTAEKFVPDPFGAPGSRLYRTGDLARWRPDGMLEFAGRADQQVKVRGFRIEIGEIEQALRTDPRVGDAVVIAREDGAGDRRLVAYVVPREGEEDGGGPTTAELREGLSARLPAYLVPGAFVLLESIPLTPNGKVDRRALPAPRADGDAYVAPRTSAEEVMAGIWAPLLGVERVGAEDDFFALGGHSLLATRVVSWVRDAFGTELPLRALFEHPTVAGLAAHVETLRGQAAVQAPPFARVPRDGPLPLSFTQERLWVVDQLEPGSAAYNLPGLVRLRGTLDAEALRWSLGEVVRRHEALRTTFRAEGGVPVQVIHPPAPFALPETDLRALDGAAREAEVGRRVREDAAAPFDLEAGPLFRAALLRVADDDAVLLFTLHHIVSDGWSMGVLVREVAALYGARVSGEDAGLPELPLQYADYAAWQRAWLQGDALEARLAYWRERLAGAPPVLELPTDHPRPAVQGRRGLRASMQLPRELADALESLSREEGATLFMTLLAAFKVLLGRLAGHEDVVVGTPVANRTRTEAEGLIGFFVNTLALRTDLSGALSFRALLGRVRETTLGAYAHQDLPFERVLDALRPERSLSHAPVFQVFFNLLNLEQREVRLPGLTLEPVLEEGDALSKFDLTLYAAPRPDGIHLSLVYDAALFAPARMAEMLAQYRLLLEQAVREPARSVAALSLVTEPARAILPDPAAPLSGAWRGSIPEVFAGWARRAPERLAAEDADERWTYGELHARSTQLARSLVGNGVAAGDVVAVYAHRSASLVWALMGILNAGAAFVVLDPSYPPLRLREYLRIAAPRALLAVEAAGPVPAELEGSLPAVRLSLPGRAAAEAAGLLAEWSTDPLPVEIGPDSLAYLAFTSGTTGMPRTVLGRHGSLTHFIPWLAETFGLDADDRFSMLSGLAHDPLQRDVFHPLQLGAAVVAPPESALETRGGLARWLREAGITATHLTPSLGKVITDLPADGAESVPGLRLAFFVGEALTRGDVARLRRLAPAVRAVNFYGATETQRALSWFDIPADEGDAPREVVPLGVGMKGAQLLVLNADGGLAGVGEAGEVYIRSPHVALGYHGDDALTAERFLPGPFATDAADRMYRTGDLGRYRPDGVVEPMGRADQQVKVRGFRVEPGEIEALLAAHPALREAVVMVREDAPGERRLVAYVVAAPGESAPDAAVLRAYLRGHVPEYMVPAAFVALDALPLTPNAKVDRRALPVPADALSVGGPDERDTPEAEMLAGIFADVLQRYRVGAHDDFFALGGHSLLATRVVSRVRDAFGVELSLRAFFEGPTAAAIATRVRRLRDEDAGASIPPLVPMPRDGALPLSFAQQRLWFIEQLNPGEATYHLPAALRLRGDLDPAVLEQALTEIVRRHESLRTTFRAEGGEPVQVIAPPAPFALPITDLRDLPANAREAAASALAADEAVRPFRLDAEPPVRALLARLDEAEWQLSFTLHHIAGDGWSLGLLVHEVSALYEAFSRGEPSPLPSLPVQYADYAVWQRAWLTGDVLDAQIGWWRELLAGAPPLLELPTDRPRPLVQGGEGRTAPFAIPAETADALRALARREGATLFMVLLAAWQGLLARYAGAEDVSVGTPIAGRTRLETERLIGFFVNTLVLRADVSGDPPFRALLGRVRETTLGAYQHQDVPFEKLVEALQPERSMSHTPLFQVLFTLQNNTREALRLGAVEAEPVEASRGAALFDLSLNLGEDGGALAGSLGYRAELFDDATAERMLGHFGALLRSVAADADLRIADVDLLDAGERARLAEWSGTERALPAELRVHRWIEAQAARTPDAVAVVFADEAVTYRELDIRANRLAQHLARLGAGPETRVGICLERSAETVVALLGVMKAGAAYLPLDPSYPADRLAYMLEDSGAPLLITQDALRNLLPAEGVRVVSVDADASAIASESDAPVDDRADADNAAYVIYTSGSTGRPKGVQVTHANATSFFAAMDERVGGTIPGTWLAVTRISFDIHVLELLWTLTRGFRVVVQPEPGRAAEGESLAEQIRRHDVTHLQCTPSLASILIAESGVEALAGLERILLGGEALPADLAAQIRSVLPDGLINMYGPTETTVWSATHAVDADGTVPIGRPIANTRVYVLDGALRAQPAGVPGELLIGGAGVTRGYLGRPGLTAERFVPDAFASEPGARMYRTGDRARWRADGALEYLGRLDAQVKVRGFRIEPGEIEAVLRAHPAVADCVVVARAASAGDTRLVVYVVGSADADEVRVHLRQSLPDYMVPAHVVTLDALPLTPNGKLDRRALPAPSDSEPAAEYVAPRTPAEEVLAGIFAAVLGVDRIGAHDDFFSLGGHSLLATRVISRVRDAFGIDLPLRVMFEAPAVDALAKRVEALARADAGVQALPPLAPVSRDEPLPLSFAQQRLWFIEQLNPGEATYHLPAALRLRGDLDPAVLEQALTEIVRRHESLRTTFRSEGGEPVQVIAPPAPFALPITDLRALPSDERDAAARALAADEAVRPFKLDSEPPVRALLARLDDAEWQLPFTLHHIAGDGWSLGLLVHEVSALYEAFSRGEPSPLPALPVQYADYAVWQRAWLTGDVLDAQIGWWRDLLAGAPPLLELPTDRPRPLVQGEEGRTAPFAIPAETADALRALARREGATLFMVLLAAWQGLLARYAGAEDVSVGTPIAGRTRLETERLIGFFVNTLVLRADLSGDPPFRALLGRVRETTLGAYQHQDVPFEKLVEALQPERSMSHTPLFQVLFTLQNNTREALRLGAVEAEPVEASRGAALFDLSLNLGEDGGALAGSLGYRAELFDDATAERMLGHFGALLRAVAADADLRIADVDLLDAGERARLAEWSGTERALPAELRVHRWIEAQAARTPDAVAVVFADEAVTYRELDIRANRLAQHLVRLGAGPETSVGICLERSAETVIALLAVMKAGAAYLPLDPSYPADRLAYMLEDSGAPLLITQEALRNLLPSEGVRVVSVDADASLIAAESDAPVDDAADADNAAYVIYTSGSTGRPKGVQVTHANATSFFAAMDERVGGTIPGTWLAVTRISFDIHVLELLWTLARGFRVVVQPEPDRAAEGESLAEQIRRHDVTHLQCTPSLASILIAESGLDALAGLERILLGGEALPMDLAAQIRSVLPDGLINMYGPTETTVWSATHAVDADGTVPIGRPIDNTRVYVLDGALHRQPTGIPGELLIGGAGVTRGYLGRPGLTAERFVPDAFSMEPGARMYRTGDRARWRADGALEYLGRLDAQVKVRGFRIEPGEIEAVLRAHPAVSDCAVVARAASAGDTRLVAYVVGSAGADALRAHLRQSLPDYMVPAHVVTLDALPLTPNGKLDRRALPAPADAEPTAEYVAPRTPAEEVLAGIFAAVLDVERVGARDDFFSLGGHSLLATRVISRVRDAFGIDLPLRVMFEAPAVDALAQRVEMLARADAGVQALPPLVPVGRDEALPLSFAQQRLWFIEQLNPGEATYHLPAALRLRGDLDPAVLEQALTEIVRRHESLRTTFHAEGGEPVQVIAAPAPFALPITDLRALPADEREAAARALAADEAVRPFRLDSEPPVRALLARLDEAEWQLSFTLHHIAGDGWSLGLLVHEVSALYEAFSRGESSPLPALPVQYADYAVWQRAWLTGDVLDAQIAWWRELLAGAPPLLELPTDRPRPLVQGEEGRAVGFVLPTETGDALRALARREGATLFMVLLAAWQGLLARYAGAEDVSVGTPIAGRTRLETEGLIGFFVNTLVLRADLSGDPPFRALLGRVRETTLGAYQHQDVPFEKLVEALQPDRSLSHTPLFQVLFTLQNNTREALRLGAVEAEPVEAARGAALFDLSLMMGEDGDVLAGSLGYRAELFDDTTAERMLGHFTALLRAVAADADRRINAVELLDAPERARLAGWSCTPNPLPAELRVHRWIEAQAERTPDDVAVIFGDDAVTYREIDARANRLAQHLVRLGAGPETRIGICLQRSEETVVALLGVLKAGGTYVPLDPSYPADRLAYMLADSRAALLVTEESLRGLLPTDGVGIVSIDADARTIAAHRPEAPETGLTAENGAYIIYTSGSTGRPKGVHVTHANAAFFLAGMDDRVGGAMPGTWLAVSRISFDIHVLELLWTLARGFRVVIQPERDRARDGETIAAQIRRHGITHLQCTPTLAAMLIAESGLEALAPLDRVFLGGEALAPDLSAQIRSVLPDGLVNLYGPTESTVWCTTHDVAADGAAPIGRPIDNARVHVLDAALRPQPIGVPGEVFVAGPGVTRGYVGRPDLTADRFIPDPFSAEPGARMYRSGDRGRWRSDGVLEYLGRLDAQVKVRGFRIEPGEIEAVLRGHPAVAECAIVAHAAGAGDTRLVAYVVGSADAETLRAHLRNTLPDYMVPAHVVMLDALPLTPSGKIDRRALPAPRDSEREGAAYTAPRTPAEEVLAGIFAAVLGTERVGARDDFFALGGHSLLATRVMARVRDAFGIDLPLRVLFEASTVQALAERVDALVRGGGGVQAPPLVPVARDGALPLSFAQQRLWFIDQMLPGTAAYNLPFALRVRGALDAEALERALTALVARHETLRTRFAAVEGEPVQVIDAPYAVRLHEIDLRGESDGDREDALRALAADEALRPFDLAAGPLFRTTLVRLGEGEHALLFTLHHIVSDGWSTGVLVREVSALYAAFAQGREPSLAPLPVQYADYAVWQRAWLAGDVLDAQLDWWRGRLAGAPPLLELPLDRPRPAVAGASGAVRRFEIRAETAEALRTLGRGEGATTFMTLLAGWQALLARYTGQGDIPVGTPIAGRTRLETEGLIGFFVNTLVLRTDVSAADTFRALLRGVREGTLGAYAHQDVPFERLVEKLAPARSLGHTPLFQVMFALVRPEADTALDLGGATLEPLVAARTVAQTDLLLRIHDAGAGPMYGVLEYRTELWDASTMDRMLVHLARLLDAAAADPDAPLARLPLVAEAERAALLGPPPAAVPAGATLHDRFAAQAARTPDAPALTADGVTLTYGELDARGNQLAHALRRRGVGPEVRVGLYLERSAETVVGILGILKAGGAYVPMDVASPPERIAFLLADSGVPVLVTQSALADGLPDHGAAVLRLDADAAEIAAESADPIDSGAAGNTLAYVIYTSGSTGTPKGVLVEHGNVVRLFGATDPWFGFGADDVWTFFHSHAFDFSVWELWGALLYGGRVVVVPPAVSRDPHAFHALLVREGVTVLNQTPSAFQQLVHADASSTDSNRLRLRTVVFGGEALEPATLRPWFDRHGDEMPRLVNMYGITETTVHVTYRPITRADAENGARSPIGRAIPDLRVVLLDDAGQMVPLGVPGEICVGGAGVARGYLDRPELTAQRFVRDPFSADPAARLYRSGDRGRLRADGELEYLGRMDQQVKLRGFRIEPGEVEAALRAHPAVRDAAAAVRDGGAGDPVLVAWVVPADGADAPDGAALRAFVRERLPDYMVPSAFVPLAALPLTANGKTDWKALPAPAAGANAREHVPPRTDAERRVAEIWARVLGVERVGATDDFFDLGGHSLRATRVISHVRTAFGAEVPVRALFEAPVLARFAEEVERMAAVPAEPAVAFVTRHAAEAVLAGGVDDLSEEELDRLLGGLQDELSSEDETEW